jgi:hypothetical protein
MVTKVHTATDRSKGDLRTQDVAEPADLQLQVQAQQQQRPQAPPADTFEASNRPAGRAPEMVARRTRTTQNTKRTQLHTRAPRQTPPPNEDITFLGLNPQGQREADRLAKQSGKKTKFIGTSKTPDVIERNGKKYDLRTRQGIDDFTRTFGLPEEQRKKVADAIEKAGPGARDEMAQLAEQWAEAERGGRIPSRLVISGHSGGLGGVWGDNNGTISMEAFRALTAAMPRAAGQIRHVHLAACNTGGRAQLDAWRKMFPNAQSVWGYAGSAPGADSGSESHLSRWERATRGLSDDLDPKVVKGTRKGENVDTWSSRGGYRLVSTGALEDLRRKHAVFQEELNKYDRGEKTDSDPQRGPLRDHYNTIQQMLRNPELPEGERATLQREAQRVLRLLYHHKVTENFAKHHQKSLEEGYRSLGLPVPDISKMSRAQVLQAIKDLEKRINESSPPEARRMLELLKGLRDLDPKTIPDTWTGATMIQLGGGDNSHVRLGGR